MNDRTNLYRQVHPGWIRNGRLSSQAFRPTPKDRERLSVYDGDQITPEAAYIHYSQSYMSAGVLAVTAGECRNLHLPVVPDPSPFPEHVAIDFSHFSKSQAGRLAKRLAKLARDRGWQYQVPTENL